MGLQTCKIVDTTEACSTIGFRLSAYACKNPKRLSENLGPLPSSRVVDSGTRRQASKSLSSRWTQEANSRFAIRPSSIVEFQVSDEALCWNHLIETHLLDTTEFLWLNTHVGGRVGFSPFKQFFHQHHCSFIKSFVKLKNPHSLSTMRVLFWVKLFRSTLSVSEVWSCLLVSQFLMTPDRIVQAT